MDAVGRGPAAATKTWLRNFCSNRRLLQDLNGPVDLMNALECNRRASQCAANAASAPVEWMATEFLKLAAQWRAMGLRENFVGQVGEHRVQPPELKVRPSAAR